MSTTGHETEAINVQDLKASLQKFKNVHVDGGVHPDAVAGNVIGEFSDTGAEFAYRPTAGAVDIESGKADYGARLERVKGNTVVMNQKWKPTFDCLGTSTVTITKNGDGSYTLNGSQETQGGGYLRSFFGDHKFYVSTGLDNDDYYFSDGYQEVLGKGGIHAAISHPNLYFRIKAGVSFDNVVMWPVFIDLTLIYGAGNEPTTPEAFEADYQKWFGKPLAYEEYDEGSLRNVKMTGIKTVGFNLWDEEWEEGNIKLPTGENDSASNRIRGKNYISVLGGQSYYFKCESGAYLNVFAYDVDKNFLGVYLYGRWVVGGAGSSDIGNQVLTIPSTCRYLRIKCIVEYGPTYKNDICINLSHSGDRDGEYEQHWESTLNVPITTLKGKLNGQGSSVVVFPDGMKKAGSVYDEIVRRGDKTYAIKRVGSVDLGTLTWVKYSESNNVFISSAAIYSTYKGATSINNLICTKYPSIPINDVYDDNIGISTIWASAGSKNGIAVCDTRYSTAPTAQDNWLDGVILNYELATPEEYLLDDFELPQNYDVDDYGTEEILLGTDGVAPILDLKYGINAGDTIKNLPHSYVSAVGEQNFTEAQKARARKNIGAAEELSEDLKEMPEVTSEALTDIYKTLEGMRENFKHLGECKATCIDSEEIPKVCGGPLVIEGAGAPAAPNVPVFVGQRYHDKTNKKVYEAFSVTNSISDWVLLN